ncbi:MAG: fdhF [Thermoleophilia bacterium]|nr:fdhF [Thermoleophilia bacterium]
MGRGASTNSIPEIENARFLFVIGSNTTEAHPVLALRIKKAVRNGATLVVADPRKIWLTKIAKHHLQLRPGTDVWLLNAMMHTILSEGLQDDDYIREFTDDFEAVREVVMRYSPEDAEKVTGVPADEIRAVARAYAQERHAAIFYTLGITEHACGVDNIWSLSNLVLMTGHLGYESTGLNALRGQNNVQGLNDSGANPMYLPGYQSVDDPEIRRKFSEAWGAEVPETPGYRLDQMMSGLHDGRVRALVLIGENPAQTEPNARHVEEGLGKLDFLISQDIFLHDMTRKYADVVLPASSFAEKDGTFTNTERRVSRVRRAAPLP